MDAFDGVGWCSMTFITYFAQRTPVRSFFSEDQELHLNPSIHLLNPCWGNGVVGAYPCYCSRKGAEHLNKLPVCQRATQSHTPIHT